MNEVAHCPRSDKILGLNEPISRRDFLDGVLMASTAMAVGAACPFSLEAQSSGATPAAPAAGWSGYSGEGDYKGSAGNTETVIQNAHAVRDGKFDTSPSDAAETGEVYDCVVVGGGQAGLSAGMLFNKQADAKRNCLILDNASIFSRRIRTAS
jgi:spermidine dehydrogenase